MQYVRILAAACLLLGPALASAQSGGAPAATPAGPSAGQSTNKPVDTSASPASPAATPGDPLDPGAAVPPLPSPDVLAGYLPFQAQPVAPWRQTNAQVTPGAAGNAAPDTGAMPMPAAPGNAGAAGPAPGGHTHHH